MAKRLKFRLEVTVDDAGQLAAADLRVRDGDTRQSKSLGGWPVATEGADLDRLFDAIRQEIGLAAARLEEDNSGDD